MDQKIINLFDEYTHKPLDRKDFLSRLIKITGSIAAANSILPLLESNYANAATILEQDENITVADVIYPSKGIEMKAYYARPKKVGKYGGIVIIHENRGLNPHIRDVARRLAKAGYLTLAVDALSPYGGTPINEDEARTLIGKLDMPQNLEHYLNAFNYLTGLQESNAKTACVGFCWGGALANQLAVHNPTLKAAIAYYGKQPGTADINKIKAKIQQHYGGLDERINAGIPAFEEALKAAGINYEIYLYEGAQHAFNNDTAPARYNEAAAKLAWERTLNLLKETIS